MRLKKLKTGRKIVIIVRDRYKQCLTNEKKETRLKKFEILNCRQKGTLKNPNVVKIFKISAWKNKEANHVHHLVYIDKSLD